MGLFFTSSNYPKCKLTEVQINLHFGKVGLVKKSATPNYGWRKQSNCIFDSDGHFEFLRFKISEFEISTSDCIMLLFVQNSSYNVDMKS